MMRPALRKSDRRACWFIRWLNNGDAWVRYRGETACQRLPAADVLILPRTFPPTDREIALAIANDLTITQLRRAIG